MKQLLITAVIVALVSFSCKKANELLYHTRDNIYFDFAAEPKDRDSLVYTFAYEPGKAFDTVFLPVRISGARAAHDRTFRLEVVEEGTTAVGGTHYEPLKDAYTMPAGSGTYALPVVLYNADPELARRSVTLRLALAETPDFGLALTGLATGKIVFSSKLEKPDWWEMWLGGYYSQVKHELFLVSSGAVHLTLSGLDAPKNLYHVGRLSSFLNDPFAWVAENTDKGYVLEQKGDSVYDFYSSSNPARRIELRRNAQSGKYYFIDENGQEVI